MSKRVPLYQQILDQLKDQILSGRLRPGDRLPSENEIAQHFYVSVITSKRALNDLADQGLIVRIKGKGSFVAGKDETSILNTRASNIKGIIGVIIPSICMPVESELFYQIQLNMNASKYQTLICITNDKAEQEEETIRMFRIAGVKGFIIFPAINENYNEEILRLSLDRFPHVLVDRMLPNITSSNVVSDNEQAMRQAVHYLFEQGYENILFITQKDTNSNTHERLFGYEKAYIDYGKPIDRSIRFVNNPCWSDSETLENLKQFFIRQKKVEAVLAIDTPLASLSYTALHELNYYVPKNVKLICFDDPKLPFVPYIRQNTQQIAKRATEILIQQMNENYQVVCEKVPTSFISDVKYPSPFGI